MLNIRNRMGQEGLTLIELLITIAVLAVVAAIAIPVVTNVVASSNTNAAAQTQSDIEDFITDGNKAGIVIWDGTRTFESYVDLNGDNVIDADEKTSELIVEDKFSISGLTNGAATVTGAYSATEIAIDPATFDVVANSQAAAPAAPAFVYDGFDPSTGVLSITLAGESLQFYAETGDTWSAADGDPWNGGPVMTISLSNANDGGHVLGDLDNNNGYQGTDGFYYLEDPDGTYTWNTPTTQDQTANEWTDSGTGNIYLGYLGGELEYLAMYFPADYASGGTPQSNTNW